jgi:predicted MFS family arabinose efflux permease
MEMLVLFRAVQGLGGGAIYALAFIIVGVLYPPEKRAQMQGIISSIWGISSILGPLAGALIVEHANWRWIFFVNLPIAAVAVGLIIVGFAEEITERHQPKLDLLGAFTLLLGLILLFYALAQSAHAHQPLNAELAVMLAIGFLILTLFYFIERRAEEPIIPLDLFPLPLYRSSIAVATLAAMGVFGAISYLPLYLQGVVGTSASLAGVVLLILSLGWTAGSLLASPGINRRGYRFTSASGMACMTCGYILFLLPGNPVGIPMALLNGFLIGVGMGLANLTTLVAAQTAVPMRRIGVATSTIMLFRTFGGAFCISLMGTVLLSQMQRGLAQLGDGGMTLSASLRDKVANPQNLLEPATRALIPQELLPELIDVLGHAIWYAFLTAFVLMVLGLSISFFMGSFTPTNTPRPDGNVTG